MTSAGLVLYRHRPDLELLIAHLGGPFWAHKDERAWTFPKGSCEPGEEPFAAALREFAEELGSPAPDVEYAELGTIRQSHKHVVLWAGEADFDTSSIVSNTFEAEWPPRSGQVQAFPEVDRAEWVAPDVARAKLVASLVPFVDRLADLVRAPTSPPPS